MEVVSLVAANLGETAAAVFAVFIRMSAFFALMPAFGERTIPVRVKLMLSVFMTIVVAPAVPPPEATLDPLQIIFTESVAGLILGIFVRLFVLALQTAGAIAAQSTTLAQLLGNNSVEPLPAIGHVLAMAGLTLTVMTGLHITAAKFFIFSYEFMPMGRFPSPELFAQAGVARVSRAFSLAFTLAAPFVALAVIYNLAIGAINKSMPQLMVALIGAPLITGGALLMLAVCAPFILTAWLTAFESFLIAPNLDG